MKNVKAPEGMIDASISALLRYEGEQDVIHGNPPTIGEERKCVREILEAAFDWQSENHPEEINDLLWKDGIYNYDGEDGEADGGLSSEAIAHHNRLIAEAFRRGQKAGSK